MIELVSIRYLSRLTDAVALYHYLSYLVDYDAGDLFSKPVVEAAVADSFDESDDYKLIAVQVCIKYRTIGRQFTDRAAILLSSTPAGVLRDKLSQFIEHDDSAR